MIQHTYKLKIAVSYSSCRSNRYKYPKSKGGFADSAILASLQSTQRGSDMPSIDFLTWHT